MVLGLRVYSTIRRRLCSCSILGTFVQGLILCMRGRRRTGVSRCIVGYWASLIVMLDCSDYAGEGDLWAGREESSGMYGIFCS